MINAKYVFEKMNSLYSAWKRIYVHSLKIIYRKQNSSVNPFRADAPLHFNASQYSRGVFRTK